MKSLVSLLILIIFVFIGLPFVSFFQTDASIYTCPDHQDPIEHRYFYTYTDRDGEFQERAIRSNFVVQPVPDNLLGSHEKFCRLLISAVDVSDDVVNQTPLEDLSLEDKISGYTIYGIAFWKPILNKLQTTVDELDPIAEPAGTPDNADNPDMNAVSEENTTTGDNSTSEDVTTSETEESFID